ncbi:MAG: HemK2/MTQ2 family protein methyltransferase [Candidatus Nanoarchaeia archaeon]
MPEIYQPAEDSFFLNSFLVKEIRELKQKKILDMGSGSGFQSKTLIENGIHPENIFLSDINKDAINNLKKEFPKSRVIESDLFKNVKDKFDLIIFNPPYLPEDKFDAGLETSGGKKGSKIINEFLKQARKHLLKNGKILILTSSFTKGIDWMDYNRKLLGKKKIFFEELYVWELM